PSDPSDLDLLTFAIFGSHRRRGSVTSHFGRSVRGARRPVKITRAVLRVKLRQMLPLRRWSKVAARGVDDCCCTTYIAASGKFIEQRLRVLQIARVKPLGKPPVNRSKQFARFPHLALVAPEACEAHGSAEFPGFGLLMASD